MHSQPRYFVISAPRFDATTPLDPSALNPKGENPGGGSYPVPSQNQPRIAATLAAPVGRFSIRSLLREGRLAALVRIRCITPASGTWQLRSAAAGEQIDPPPIDQPLAPVRPLTQEWSEPVEAGTTDAVVVSYDFEGPVQPQIEIEVSEFSGELAVAVLAAKSKVCCDGAALTDDAPTQIDVGDTAQVGVATTAARADHEHALPAPGAPANVTKAPASAGVSSKVAREDHKHDIDTGVPVTVRGANNQEGTATSLARSDHKHRNEIQVEDDGVLVGARPTLNFIGDAVSVVDNGGLDRLDITITAATLTNTAPTQIDVGDTAQVGAATTAARADHEHALPAPGAPENVTKAPASAGVSSKVAREDHKHDIDTGVPVAVRGANNQEGTATSLARSDHKHRNEVQIQKDGALVGARPTLNFIGDGVTVADDNVQDRLNITVSNAGGDCVPGLAETSSSVEDTIPTMPTTFLDVEFVSDTKRVRVEATGSIVLANANDPNPVSVNYWLEVDGLIVPGTFGRIATSVAPDSATLSIAASGVAEVAPGAHLARLVAQGNGDEMGTTRQWVGERSLGVSRWR